MEDKNKQSSEPVNNPDALANYNPQNRDFERTEEDLDDVSKSEKEELEERKRRTHVASSKPDKNHVG